MKQKMNKIMKSIKDAWVWINKQDNKFFEMKAGDSISISNIKGLRSDLEGTLIESNWNSNDGWEVILVHDRGQAHWKQKYDGGYIKEVTKIETT